MPLVTSSITKGCFRWGPLNHRIWQWNLALVLFPVPSQFSIWLERSVEICCSRKQLFSVISLLKMREKFPYNPIHWWPLKDIYNFLKRILQVVDNAAFWENVLLYFQNDRHSPSFLDVFYCGRVTYQIWAWFETFEGNVNQTNTVKRGALGCIRNRKTEEKIVQNRKTAKKSAQNRKLHTKPSKPIQRSQVRRTQ